MVMILSVMFGIAFFLLYIWGWIKLYRDEHRPGLSDEELRAKINEIQDESVRKYYLTMLEMQKRNRSTEE